MDAKAKANQILQELGYDFRVFTIEGFVRHVGETSGREIITIPWAMPPMLFGAWISDEEPREYIFYRNDVSGIHQIHIQLHELSHFLFGHPTLQINQKLIADVASGQTSLPFADLPRLRSPNKTSIETEAETLASLIQKQVIQNSQLDQLTHFSAEGTLADYLKAMGKT
jgi:hypothetical protein